MARKQTKLQRMQVIQQRIQDRDKCNKTQAAEAIAKMTGRSLSAVQHWLSETQDAPVPDPILELLELKVGI